MGHDQSIGQPSNRPRTPYHYIVPGHSHIPPTSWQYPKQFRSGAWRHHRRAISTAPVHGACRDDDSRVVLPLLSVTSTDNPRW